MLHILLFTTVVGFPLYFNTTPPLQADVYTWQWPAFAVSRYYAMANPTNLTIPIKWDYVAAWVNYNGTAAHVAGYATNRTITLMVSCWYDVASLNVAILRYDGVD